MLAAFNHCMIDISYPFVSVHQATSTKFVALREYSFAFKHGAVAQDDNLGE